MSNNTGKLTLKKGFQNPYLAFYLKQMDNLNSKSELNLELFGSILFSTAGAGAFQFHFFSELELELLGSIFLFRAGAHSHPSV